jgi:serine/threonine protein kinase
MPHAPELHSTQGRRRNREHDPRIGTMVDDRFLIEARLATGGFGAIYRAHAPGGELVALKVLHPRLTSDPNMVARFRREGAALAQLHDPHTVRTRAVGEARDGTLYIAMELLSGESLHERLHRVGALPWQRAIAIARAVCSSLAEAHALGVVHRDLKPENIHVEAQGDGGEVVKVIDFGIAKIVRGSAIDDGKELTSAGYMIGTYDYMSPEQIVGSPCDGQSDIYSLGVVTYEMITGRRPFSQVTGPASMMTALVTQAPAPPSILAAIPPELDRIVMRCLEREPADRFPDIRALAAALDRMLDRVVDHVVDRVPGTPPAPREDVTVECPAQRPIRTDRFPATTLPGGAPGATAFEEERTWIDHAARTIPDLDPSGVTSESELPWALPRVDAHGVVPTCPARRIAPGTRPVTVRAQALAAPCAPGDVLYTTLPGIAVATRRCPTHHARPAQAGLPATLPLVPLAGQAAPRPAWSPAPASPVPSSAIWATPLGPLASGSGPRLPARSHGLRWFALVIASTAALVLAAAI